MKSRINIWSPKGRALSPIGSEEASQQNNIQIQNGKTKLETDPQDESAFEYEPIKPIQKAPPNRISVQPEEGDYPPMDRKGGGLLNKSQKRRHSLSVACSEEEADILRDAARGKGMTFSNWARRTLFRSAGLAMPKRPK